MTTVPIDPQDDNSAPFVRLLIDGYVVLIDATEFESISRFTWHAKRHPRTGKVYVYTTVGKKRISMHHMIAGTPKGLDIDHVNTNSLDNRKSNLRPATRSENNANRVKHSTHAGKPTTSRFKGVTWDVEKRRWRAAIRVEGRAKRLGRFRDETEAARAYDRAALAQWGEFARLNFADEVAR